MYDIEPFNSPKFKKSLKKIFKNQNLRILLATILISSFFGFAAGFFSSTYFYLDLKDYLQKLNINIPLLNQSNQHAPQTSQEQAIIDAVRKYSPAVVSIVISKDVPIIEEYFYNPFGEDSPFLFEIPGYRQKGTEKQEIGGGTGFIVSDDGLILTNKHVVLDGQAEYTVFTNEGEKYPAKVLAKDPVQDLAIIKIDTIDSNPFPVVKLGESDNLQIGQTVIAIGNALGEFRNTVSVGVISGLGRTVSAYGDGGFSETLEDIIQTDAAINRGNSGGPLLNLKGEVIGINTAIAETAQNIGFALPINIAKRDIKQIRESGKIIYPFLGIRYVLLDEQLKEENNLSVDRGAWIVKGEKGEKAVVSGSAADKAGIKENDIILELNGEKITQDNSLTKIISKYSPEDKVVLKILRDEQETDVDVILGERSE